VHVEYTVVQSKKCGLNPHFLGGNVEFWKKIVPPEAVNFFILFTGELLQEDKLHGKQPSRIFSKSQKNV
jgi:hypothetical protein